MHKDANKFFCLTLINTITTSKITFIKLTHLQDFESPFKIIITVYKSRSNKHLIRIKDDLFIL